MHTGILYINDNVIETLLACSVCEQEKGLMGQPWPPPVMTFLYKTPRINKFWMKNTPSPLDILFCYKNKITQICKGIPYSLIMIGDNSESDCVIELPANTCKLLNIIVGDDAGLLSPDADSLRKILK
jgi:uncharacterized protein